MRCLTLADSLQASSDDICFVCRSVPPYLRDKLAASDHRLILLPPVPQAAASDRSAPADTLAHAAWLGASQEQDAAATLAAIAAVGCDWLVVDHYGIDHRWESALREKAKRILVIDDLADRKHNCDALIDQNLYRNMNSRYAGKVPEDCTLFLGPRYAFLRKEFHYQRQQLRTRSGEVHNLLIYFGGVDANNHTLEAIEALLQTNHNLTEVNIVIGAQHPDSNNIQSTCTQHGFNCHVQTSQMAGLMAAADLAIGAGGISAYERLYLRLPSILRPIADNQIEQLECMAAADLCELYEDRADLVIKLKRALTGSLAIPDDCVADGNRALVDHMMS